jgi:hypothetical protein
MRHLIGQRIYHAWARIFALPPAGNKFDGGPVLLKVVAGNNGYAGATGCEALSDFALVSGHGFLLP